LDSFSRGEETFPNDQPPLVLSIATSADWTTRLIFPVGQWIGMDRTELLKKTIGNYPSYRTHVLEPDVAECLRQNGVATLTEVFR